MTKQLPVIGDILHHLSDDAFFRYLQVLPDEGLFVVFPMPEYLPKKHGEEAAIVEPYQAQKPSLPIFWSISETLESLNEMRLKIIQNDSPALDPAYMTDGEKKYQERIRPVIQMLGFREPEIYFPETRHQLIQEAEFALKLSRQTIYSHLRVFWLAGKDFNKITSKFHHCGGRGKPRISTNKKLGRPRSVQLQQDALWGVGVNASQADRDQIKLIAREGLKAGWDLSRSYRTMVNRHYWQDILQPDGSLKFDYSKHLTFEQFKFHAAQVVNEEDKARARLQSHTFEQHTRARHKGTRQANFEVGRVFQIDGTKLNIPVVSRTNRNHYIGTAISIHVTEIDTGMLVGFWVGLEHEVYEAIMMALVVTVTDKVEFCSRYGIEIEGWEWPAHHFCQSIVADRGSAYFQEISDCIAHVLGHNPMINTPAYRADLKGVVESINGAVKSWAASNVDSAYRGKGMTSERGSPDPRMSARYNLNEVIRAHIYATIAHNIRINSKYPTFPELVAEGVPTTPIHIWNWALANHRHRLTRRSPLDLELQLMPRVKASITPGGIYVGSELYYAPEEGRPPWYRHLEQKEAKVEVARNRYCVDYIFLPHPEQPRQSVRCALLPKSEQFRGMTLMEVEETRRQRNVVNKLYEPTQRGVELRIDHARKQDQQRAGLEQTLTRDPNQSKADIVGNARERRNTEKKLERAKIPEHLAGLGQGQRVSPAPSAPVETDGFTYPDFDEEL